MHKRVKLRIIMFRLLAVLAMLSAWVNGAHSSPNDSVKVLPDSSNFVTASLLTISPADEIYSVFGHTAIRMECPVYKLDYVFTFESDPSVDGFLTFFAGKAKAKFLAVPTDEFLGEMRTTGRGVRQYELNLTHHEKQELWRHLDEDMMEGEHRKFNLLLNNCVSVSILKIQESCIDEYLEWGQKEWPLTESNAVQVAYYCRYSPWMKFMSLTFAGTALDKEYDIEYHISPDLVVPALQKATFVSTKDGSRRKVITDKSKELLPKKVEIKQSPVTPALLLGSLLVLTLFLTFAEWRWNWKNIAHVLDMVLFTVQSLCGILLVYITYVSEIFGTTWNWYLIPFNPIPLFLWLCLRKQKSYGRVYLLYTVVLVAFVILTPFVSQLDWEHQLITVILAVRCINNYYLYKVAKI